MAAKTRYCNDTGRVSRQVFCRVIYLLDFVIIRSRSVESSDAKKALVKCDGLIKCSIVVGWLRQLELLALAEGNRGRLGRTVDFFC